VAPKPDNKTVATFLRETLMAMQRASDHYRKWADELRLAATEAPLPENRDTLIAFATDLDELADEAEVAEAEQRMEDPRIRSPARAGECVKRRRSDQSAGA
jgi:hypothetical protein